MRLFIAINFNDNIKKSLYDSAMQLKQICGGEGNFTKLDNFHLTLVFIGETTKVGKIVEIIDSVDQESFKIKFANIGKFRRTGGDIYWLGVEKSRELLVLQKYLQRAVSREDIVVERREFKPHLTLCRECPAISAELDGISFYDEKVVVDKISLMKSERDIYGNLVYTEIYSKNLSK